MTHEKYISHLKVCEFLHKEPIGDYKKLHDFLTDLWKDMEFRTNPENYRTILHKNDTHFLRTPRRSDRRTDRKNGNDNMWCNHILIWSFLQKDMNMEIPEIQYFIKNVVEEHLKCEAGTPMYGHTPDAALPPLGYTVE